MVNNTVTVTGLSSWCGHEGHVLRVMADGRTLEVRLRDKVVFIDVTMVRGH
jgi:hypothetical protein